VAAASERRGSTVKGFKDFYLKAMGRMWLGRSYVCHILSPSSSSSLLLLSSLKLSATKVYEPYIRARLGTAAHFCEVVVLKSPGGAGAAGSALAEQLVLQDLPRHQALGARGPRVHAHGKAPPGSKVDGFVPQSQNINLRIVRQKLARGARRPRVHAHGKAPPGSHLFWSHRFFGDLPGSSSSSSFTPKPRVE